MSRPLTPWIINNKPIPSPTSGLGYKLPVLFGDRNDQIDQRYNDYFSIRIQRSVPGIIYIKRIRFHLMECTVATEALFSLDSTVVKRAMQPTTAETSCLNTSSMKKVSRQRSFGGRLRSINIVDCRDQGEF